MSVAAVTEPDDDSVTITGVSQDEPTNGLGYGDTSPDAIVQGGPALIRAEPSGTGDDRAYRRRLVADDGLVSVQAPQEHETGQRPQWA